ncbi:hypothetical protein V6N11_001566 [Hibiscus sabdariffa]|uniref:Uncharacterized protein n=1 Tax=Hibiscus sabdariffa TaxID=183260 RepID=A0ABR2S026_9ROSI
MIPLPLARMMVIGTRGIGTVAKGVAFVAPLAMMDDPMANKGAIAGCSVAGGSALSLVTKAGATVFVSVAILPFDCEVLP